MKSVAQTRGASFWANEMKSASKAQKEPNPPSLLDPQTHSPPDPDSPPRLPQPWFTLPNPRTHARSIGAIQYSARRERRCRSWAMAARRACSPARACVVARGSIERACRRHAHGRRFGAAVSTPARWRRRRRLEPRTSVVLQLCEEPRLSSEKGNGGVRWPLPGPSTPSAGVAHRPPPRRPTSLQNFQWCLRI
jgi:hypothetical protein